MKFSLEKYIGLSNDTLTYVKNVNDFVENANLITGLEVADIEKVKTLTILKANCYLSFLKKKIL